MIARAPWIVLAGTVALAGLVSGSVRAGEKATKIVFIAGPMSHGYGSHEHNAGCLLLAHSLAKLPNVQTQVYQDGQWPEDPQVLQEADAIVIFSNGGGGHPIVAHLDQVEGLVSRGVGLALSSLCR